MENQTTDTILMIEPVAFGYNAETAVNNYFQQKDSVSPTEIQAKALAEFNGMVSLLRKNGIRVITLKDTYEPHTPDSVFPNNWISFHAGGRIALYPMFAENRRFERRKDILETVMGTDYSKIRLTDFTVFENNNRFLEGTGSMILDRKYKIAYAALSRRTDKELLERFCSEFDYRPVSFHANQTVDEQRLPIYHTNVMLCVADGYVVVCAESIDGEAEKKEVFDAFEESGKKVVEISAAQMHAFAGNMLQVQNAEGTKFLVMSETALNSLDQGQVKTLTAFNRIIAPSVTTIEKYGGGSVRCMMAEVFK